MALDNVAVVNTLLVPTILINKNGQAISHSTQKTEKEIYLSLSQPKKYSILSQQTLAYKYYIPQEIRVNVDSVQSNRFLLKPKSSTISDSNNFWSIFSSKTSYSYIENKTSFGNLEIPTVTKQTVVRDCFNIYQNIKINNGHSIVRSNLKSNINHNLKVRETLANVYVNNYLFNSANVLVDDLTNSTNLFGNAKMNSVSILVEDYRPINLNGNAIGGGLKSFMLVAQKMSFFEVALSFTQGRVVNVSSLPMGVYYENGRIKGSPISSGYYPITIHLDNGSKIEGIIIVPYVPRQL